MIFSTGNVTQLSRWNMLKSIISFLNKSYKFYVIQICFEYTVIIVWVISFLESITLLFRIREGGGPTCLILILTNQSRIFSYDFVTSILMNYRRKNFTLQACYPYHFSFFIVLCSENDLSSMNLEGINCNHHLTTAIMSCRVKERNTIK